MFTPKLSKQLQGLAAVSFVCSSVYFSSASMLHSITSPETVETKQIVMLNPNPVATMKPIATQVPLVSRGDIVRPNRDRTIAVLNASLEGKLKGMGETFVTAGEKWDVNAKVLAAICMLETRNGTSTVLRDCNNVAGINWEKTTQVKKDGNIVRVENPYKKKGWYNMYPSVASSINDMAQRMRWFYIDEGRTDIDAIGAKWAPTSDPRDGMYGMNNKEWPRNITKIFEELEELERSVR